MKYVIGLITAGLFIKVMPVFIEILVKG